MKQRIQDEIGTKLFQYPEVFEKFLKAVNPELQNYATEEYHKKQIELEQERMDKEREATELKEKKAKLELAKKKSARTKNWNDCYFYSSAFQ